MISERNVCPPLMTSSDVVNLVIETSGITLSKRLLDTAIELSNDIKNRTLT